MKCFVIWLEVSAVCVENEKQFIDEEQLLSSDMVFFCYRLWNNS